MEVRESQNPIDFRKEYLGYKFQLSNKTENILKIHLPTIFTIKAFEPMILRIRGKDAILYLI
jgi:hypothetical protein